MTIEITQPELEALILLRMKSGAFASAEDVVWQAMRAAPVHGAVPAAKDTDSRAASNPQTLEEVFAMVRGLADDVDFSRDPSTGRALDLS
jgi:hypothetical protein